ncbi:hypothetical protein H0H92_005523 [Tricholoma furcatifolium]|nr:hypothetical protein H0H92_005523 [Tricholoma furcatifolium]
MQPEDLLVGPNQLRVIGSDSIQVANAGRLIKLWRTQVLGKFLNPQEKHLRKVLCIALEIDEDSDSLNQYINLLDESPPDLVLISGAEAKTTYASVDTGDLSKIDVNFNFASALEHAGGHQKTVLSFHMMITLLHECLHWLRYKENPANKSREAYGQWFGDNIQDYGQQGESGYIFEGKLLGGVLGLLGTQTRRPSTKLIAQNHPDFKPYKKRSRCFARRR